MPSEESGGSSQAGSTSFGSGGSGGTPSVAVPEGGSAGTFSGGTAGTGSVSVPQGCTVDQDVPFQSRPLPSGTFENLRSYLDAVRTDMLGSWRGIVTTPWVDPYPVELTFREGGQYSSRCLIGECIAFYYGTDDDTELKQYRLETLDIYGIASGEIDIAFGEYSNMGTYYLAGWQGLLEELEVSADARRMIFEFWRNDGYGPVTFDLSRCTTEQ